MDNITPNFRLQEFACHDGTPYPGEWIESRLAPLCEALEILRATLREPVLVVSGYRTPGWNRQIKGARNSQHLHGRAVDIVCRHQRPEGIYARLIALIAEGSIPDGGVHLYGGFVHYDQRGHKARW
jgi:uncharacterized protein YcbK (DUF882 family)